MSHQHKGSILAMAVVVFFAFAPCFTGTAAAKEFQMKKAKFSGSFISTVFTLDSDEQTTSTTVTGKGNRLGEFSSHTISEFTFTTPEIFIVEDAKGVITYKFGQLYLAYPDSPPPTDGGEFIGDDGNGNPIFTLTITYEIIGGSGKFAGAQGSITSTSTGILLFSNVPDDDQFGGVNGTFEGSFSTPD